MEDIISVRRKLLDEYQATIDLKNKYVLELNRASRVYNPQLEEQIKIKIYEKNRKLEQIEAICKKTPALDLVNIKNVFATADIETELYGNKLKNDIENIR